MTSPLNNRVIISTRPKSQAEELQRLIRREGGILLHLPMIETQGIVLSDEDENILLGIREFNWIVISSPFGAEMFFQNIERLNINSQKLELTKFAAIGQATARVIEKKGITVNFIDTNGNGESFGRALNERSNAKEKIVVCKGQLANDDLLKWFIKGQQVERINLYNTLKPKAFDSRIVDKISNNEYDLLFFSSPSGFNNFAEHLKYQLKIRDLRIACIGPTTANALVAFGVNPKIVCKSPLVTEVVKSFTEYFTYN